MEHQKQMADQFSQSLELLQRLKSENKVFISFVPPFDLTFEIDKNALPGYLKESNFTAQDFKKASSRISSLLLAILQNDKKEFIASYIKRHELEGKKEEEKTTELNRYFTMVENALLNDHLQQRYNLKASSKAPTFTSIDWDIKLKVRDAQLEDIRFPYATCRITYQREYTSSYTAFLGGRSFDSVQLNFSLEEIKYLIKVFQGIKQALQDTEKETTK